MNLLFEIYGFSYPMMESDSRLIELLELIQGMAMLIKSVVTMLCMAGVAFYVRFLFALRIEGKPRLIEHWSRLTPGVREIAPAQRLRFPNERSSKLAS
jgi:hypothetical protein